MHRDEDAINRVSDPYRYRPLWDAAERILAELEQAYRVKRKEGPDIDRELSGRKRDRVVRLKPDNAGAASVTICFAGASGDVLRGGLDVRLGRYFRQLLPSCGCDYCDENPDDLWDDIAWKINAVVSGGFVEETGSRQHSASFALGSQRRVHGLVNGNRRRTRIEWRQWVRRQPGLKPNG